MKYIKEARLNNKILVCLEEALQVVNDTRAKEFRIRLEDNKMHTNSLNKVTTDSTKISPTNINLLKVEYYYLKKMRLNIRFILLIIIVVN